MTEWLVVDGPLRGQWRPGSNLAMQVLRPAVPSLPVVSGDGDVITPRSAVDDGILTYLPRKLRVPGWRIYLNVWAISTTLEQGTVLPGRIKGERAVSEPACAICYGRPMGGMETCSRVACIRAWQAIKALYSYLSEER